MEFLRRIHRCAWARPMLVALAVFGAALVVSRTRAQQEQPPQPEPVRAAVVRVDHVLSQSQQWQDAAQQRADMAERADRVLKPLDRQRRALERAVHDFPIGTEDRREAERAHREKEMEYQRKRSELSAEMEEQFATSYRAILAEIESAAGRYAQDHGIQLVLKQGSTADMDNQPDLLDVHTRQVIYAAPELDISEEVIRMLNARYEAPIEDK